MAVRDLPGAPFKIGQRVIIQEPGIKGWTANVMACKPTRDGSWWVSLNVDGCEVIVHQKLVTSVVVRT